MENEISCKVSCFNYIMILQYEGKRELLTYLKCKRDMLIVLSYLNSINNTSNISNILYKFKINLLLFMYFKIF